MLRPYVDSPLQIIDQVIQLKSVSEHRMACKLIHNILVYPAVQSIDSIDVMIYIEMIYSIFQAFMINFKIFQI